MRYGTCGTLRVKKRAEDYEREDTSMKTAAICFLGMLAITFVGLAAYVVHRLFS